MTRIKRGISVAWLAGAAVLATTSVPASAAPSAREAALEARLVQLESAVMELRAQLDAEKVARADAQAAAQSQIAVQQSAVAAAEKRVSTLETKPTAPVEGFRSGNTNIKLGGFIKTVATFSRWDDGDVAANALGRDFYLPQQIPIGGVRESTDNDVHAKHTRLWMNLATDLAGHTLKGYVETDFQTAAGTQGSERTTNGYNLALRRAYVQFDNLTVGQDWSTFQYVAALPESTDFVGVTEGTTFVREPLIRYSKTVGKGTMLHLGIENAETASATLGSAALVENDDDRMPDFTARLNHTGKFGEISLSGVVRQLAVDNGLNKATGFGWGLSGAGKLPIGKAGADLRFMLTYGKGLGRYVGLNFAPDAIYVPATNKLHEVGVLAGFAAVRLPINKAVRANIMGSFQSVDYPDGFAAGTFNAFNEKAWSISGNIFWTPAKGFDLGIEYRHGERGLVSGASGQLDRLEFAAKYSF
jgi:hypothetical protein